MVQNRPVFLWPVFSFVSYNMYKAFLPVHPIHDISGTALLSQLKYCSTVLVFSCADLD